MNMIIQGDCLEEMKKMADNSIDFIVTDPPYGLNFMGKKWDAKVPNIEIWKETLRVCKPGSMLAAFGGSRTHHHLMMAIEQAGWEIRDTMIFWCYGSAFPKSLNISKAIDKMKGLERKVIGEHPHNSHHANPNDSRHANSTIHEFHGMQNRTNVTAPNSDLAKTFSGYKTSLKPAYEPIILAMKPLDGTFAKNAEKWGVAGINIDESRIETDESWTRPAGNKKNNFFKTQKNTFQQSNDLGRYPANLILSEEAAQALDEMTGISKSSKGASRFFYCAKTSLKERGEGNKHPTVKPLTLMKYILNLLAPPGDPIVLDPFAGSGSTLLAAKELGIRYIGIEKEEEYCEIANKRLEKISA
jgi:site-specific DNA-methyltransferase (adenine-specific)